MESSDELEILYDTDSYEYDECIDNITNEDIEDLCCQRKNGTEYIRNTDIPEKEYQECISKCGYVNFEVCDDESKEEESKDYERFFIIKSYVTVIGK